MFKISSRRLRNYFICGAAAILLSFYSTAADASASDGRIQTPESVLSAEKAGSGVQSAVSIENTDVVLSKQFFIYNGKVQKPSILSVGGRKLTQSKDYRLTWSSRSSSKAGTYTITLKGIGNYTGQTKTAYTIQRADNPVSIAGKKITLKRSVLKKHSKKVKRSKVLKIRHAQGKVTFDKTEGDPKIRIHKKTGRVTVKKGIKKGTHTVTVRVIVSGNSNYEPADKTISFKIRIK